MWRQINYGLLSSCSGILLISVLFDSLCRVFYEVRVFSKYSVVDGLPFRRWLFRADIRSILLQYPHKNYTTGSAEDAYAQSYRSVGYEHCP